MDFLSPEWIAALGRAADEVDDPALAGVSLSVQHRVDDVTWHIVIADGAIRVEPGPASDADVRFESSRSVAASIAQGQRAATDAFMSGELRLGGRLDVLISEHRALTAIDDCFATVRAQTIF